MRIIYLSSPEFGIPAFEKLLNSHHEILAVVSQPDKPANRGKKLAAPPMKECALAHGVKVLQYQRISRDGVEELKAMNPDIMITAAYGQILSQAIIDIPKYGIINVHGSLLPKYRGASPIQSAILHGDKETGITIMQTEASLDTGDILSTIETEIGEEETAGELMSRLAVLGADLLVETLDKIENGEIVPTKQQHADATITTKINKEDCLVNFNKSSKQIKCLVLAANPDPVARCILNGETVKIYRARETDMPNSDKAPGTIIEPSGPKTGVFVQCGQGVLEIVEAQFPGGKVLTGKQLASGRKLTSGMKFMPMSFPMHHEE